MKLYQILIALIFAFPCLMKPVIFAQDVSGYVNVKNYIDKSTNKNDHTEAIREAIAASAKMRNGGLLFPPGHYNISDTIDVSAVNEIVGQAYATIQQNNPEKDIFYSCNVWRITVRGLSFHGGRDQVALGNKNIDQGFFIVSDCRFTEARGVAVRFIRKGDWGTASTFCLVEKCAFSDCVQTLIAVSDQSHLRDCWITTQVKKKDNKAVIENYGVLTCQNILGVPHVSNNDLRWIDNYGTLTCKTFRFGGEGAGFTPVVNYAKYESKLLGGGITLEDCCICALGNNKRACAIYLEEIPNQIIIKGCCLAGVPAVKVSPKIELKTYFNGARPGMLNFDVASNIGEFSGALPTEMLEAAARRKVGDIDYGDKQLSAADTEKALATAVAAAKNIPSAKETGVMTWNGMKDGHRQVTDPAKYVEINLKTHTWDLSDTLDGITELASAYLAIAPAGDDIVLMSRMDVSSYPHVRIRNITVDLDKTPYLTWRLKDNGVKGGHMGMKIIDNATEQMTLLVEDYESDQFGYFAYDLRQALGIPHGKVNFDLKFYMCGVRITGPQSSLDIKKGDYFLIDFIRLEAEQ